MVTWVLLGIAAWVFLAMGLALFFGRMVKLRDRFEAPAGAPPIRPTTQTPRRAA